MKITPLYSGSAGNAYLVTVGATRFLIECGGTPKSLREGLRAHGLILSDIRFCLISHEHRDHCAAGQALLIAGVDVYATRGTIEAIGITGPAVHEMRHGEWQTAHGLDVVTFAAQHDAADPAGFIVKAGRNSLLYITDSWYVDVRYRDVTHLMVECNHDEDLLAASDAAHAQRVSTSHLSLSEALRFTGAVMQNHTGVRPSLREVWLIHLSDRHSDEERFRDRFRALTGVPVYVAGGKAAEVAARRARVAQEVAR